MSSVRVDPSRASRRVPRVLGWIAVLLVSAGLAWAGVLGILVKAGLLGGA